MISCLVLAALSLSDPQPLPVVAINTKFGVVEIISADEDEFERLVVWTAALADPITIDDCLSTAQIACGTAGISWLRYKVNSTTGEYTCEFGCNTTGSGG